MGESYFFSKLDKRKVCCTYLSAESESVSDSLWSVCLGFIDFIFPHWNLLQPEFSPSIFCGRFQVVFTQFLTSVAFFFGTWAVSRYVNGGNCKKVRKRQTCEEAGSLGAFWKVRKYKPEQEALVMFTLLTKWETVDRTSMSVAMDNTAEKSEVNLRWMGCFFGNSERDLGTPAA